MNDERQTKLIESAVLWYGAAYRKWLAGDDIRRVRMCLRHAKGRLARYNERKLEWKVLGVDEAEHLRDILEEEQG